MKHVRNLRIYGRKKTTIAWSLVGTSEWVNANSLKDKIAFARPKSTIKGSVFTRQQTTTPHWTSAAWTSAAAG